VRWENTAAGPVGFSALLDAVGGLYSTTAALAAHYLFTASTNDVSFNYTGGSAEDQTAALPRALSVTVNGTRMTLPRATPPPLINGAYDYSAENSAATTLRFTPSTGLFKGNFNLYYDYLLNARLQHRTVRVPYAGVLTPLRGEDFADEPAGQGSYLAPDNDPLFRAYRLKRSYKVVLDAAP